MKYKASSMRKQNYINVTLRDFSFEKLINAEPKFSLEIGIHYIKSEKRIKNDVITINSKN